MTGTATRRASTTIYYKLGTFDPFGQPIMRSTILGSPLPTPPHCKVRPAVEGRELVPAKGTSADDQ